MTVLPSMLKLLTWKDGPPGAMPWALVGTLFAAGAGAGLGWAGLVGNVDCTWPGVGAGGGGFGFDGAGAAASETENTEAATQAARFKPPFTTPPNQKAFMEQSPAPPVPLSYRRAARRGLGAKTLGLLYWKRLFVDT